MRHDGQDCKRFIRKFRNFRWDAKAMVGGGSSKTRPAPPPALSLRGTGVANNLIRDDAHDHESRRLVASDAGHQRPRTCRCNVFTEIPPEARGQRSSLVLRRARLARRSHAGREKPLDSQLGYQFHAAIHHEVNHRSLCALMHHDARIGDASRSSGRGLSCVVRGRPGGAI